MTLQMNLEHTSFEARAISPFQEMGAYEALWCQKGTTFNRLAKQFAEHPGSLPSNFVSPEDAQEYAAFVFNKFEEAEIKFGVRVHGAGNTLPNCVTPPIPWRSFTIRAGGISRPPGRWQ